MFCQVRLAFTSARIDRATYHKMMAAKQLAPKRKQGMQPKMKMNLTLFFSQLKFLNFRANMGTSQTSNMQKSNMKRKRNTALNLSETKKACCPNTSEPQKSALAGVGRPMNWLLCRSSKLNLANRNAEKAAIIKAV